MLADNIFVPDLGYMKIKIFKYKPKQIITEYIHIPPYTRDLHNKLTLAIDITFFNGEPFIVTVYRKIKLTTVNHNKEHIMPAMIKYIKNMVNAYLWGDFNIDNLTTYG